MNGAGGELNSTNRNLCIRPVNCHHSHYLISNGAFDYWSVPLKDPQRRVLNGVENAHGHLNKLILVRNVSNIFPKCPEHNYLSYGFLVLSEQFKRAVPSISGGACVLNPGGLRQFGDMQRRPRSVRRRTIFGNRRWGIASELMPSNNLWWDFMSYYRQNVPLF